MDKQHSNCDSHHLLWPKSAWNVGYKKALRDHWYLKIEMPKKTLHGGIHSRLPQGIPAPSGKIAKAAFMTLIELESRGLLHKGDRIEHRLMVIRLLLSSSPATADALEEEARCVIRYYRSRI